MGEDREEAMTSIGVQNDDVWTIVGAAKKDIKKLQSVLKGELKGTAAGLHEGGGRKKQAVI